jgi:hypothetical protein
MTSPVAHQIISAAAKGGYGTGGLKSWIQDNVVTLIIIILGIAILWAARGGNVGKGITIAAGALVGLAVLGMASGNNANDIGTFIVSLFQQG